MMLESKAFDPMIPTDFFAFYAHEILNDLLTLVSYKLEMYKFDKIIIALFLEK